MLNSNQPTSAFNVLQAYKKTLAFTFAFERILKAKFAFNKCKFWPAEQAELVYRMAEATLPSMLEGSLKQGHFPQPHTQGAQLSYSYHTIIYVSTNLVNCCTTGQKIAHRKAGNRWMAIKTIGNEHSLITGADLYRDNAVHVVQPTVSKQ